VFPETDKLFIHKKPTPGCTAPLPGGLFARGYDNLTLSVPGIALQGQNINSLA